MQSYDVLISCFLSPSTQSKINTRDRSNFSFKEVQAMKGWQQIDGWKCNQQLVYFGISAKVAVSSQI